MNYIQGRLLLSIQLRFCQMHLVALCTLPLLPRKPNADATVPPLPYRNSGRMGPVQQKLSQTSLESVGICVRTTASTVTVVHKG